MKLSIVIVCLAAIAAGVVHFRRERTHLRNEVETMDRRQRIIRRDLWDQQVRLARLIAPAEVRRRYQDMGLPMIDRARLPQGPAAPAVGGARPPRNHRD